jgi:hypothetical protein
MAAAGRNLIAVARYKGRAEGNHRAVNAVSLEKLKTRPFLIEINSCRL